MLNEHIQDFFKVFLTNNNISFNIHSKLSWILFIQSRFYFLSMSIMYTRIKRKESAEEHATYWTTGKQARSVCFVISIYCDQQTRCIAQHHSLCWNVRETLQMMWFPRHSKWLLQRKSCDRQVWFLREREISAIWAWTVGMHLNVTKLYLHIDWFI